MYPVILELIPTTGLMSSTLPSAILTVILVLHWLGK